MIHIVTEKECLTEPRCGFLTRKVKGINILKIIHFRNDDLLLGSDWPANKN